MSTHGQRKRPRLAVSRRVRSVLVEVGMHMGNRSAYFVADHVLASIDYIQARRTAPGRACAVRTQRTADYGVAAARGWAA